VEGNCLMELMVTRVSPRIHHASLTVDQVHHQVIALILVEVLACHHSININTENITK